MHELSLCQSLIRQVSQIAAQHTGKTISAIELSIGPLASVEVDLLHTAFTHAKQDSCAKDAQLLISSTTPRAHCPQCQSDFEADIADLRCPQCGDAGQLRSGDEMNLTGIRFKHVY
jgi:hydrogenase nickel incorporation protein HypA/HybF